MRPFRLFRKRQRAYQQVQLQKHKVQQQAIKALQIKKGQSEDEDAYLFI